MTSPICARRYFCLQEQILSFALAENCVNTRVGASFHSSQNFNIPLYVPLKEKYFTCQQNKNTKWGLVKRKASLCVLWEKTNDIKRS